ncbi:hypothetical protein U14_01917 [Candidatus Moduliflexus flocculans]|uniref:Uncharacterized protein n=1 Tax=Candidatus Moduliflexus flocculans TaxID=1499966 RepID=A0A0S6VXN9_9BACT|nr:hypothetical protein U14_01917 [Candidatus Moduliflexus flocculans]
MKPLYIVLNFICCGLLCLLTNCQHDSSPSNPIPEPTPTTNASTVIKDGIEYLLQTDRVTYQIGEIVTITYRVTNREEAVQNLGFLINQQEIYLVIESHASVLWEYDNNPTGRPTAPREFSLSAGASETFTVRWKIPSSFTPGNYEVKCQLLLSPYPGNLPVIAPLSSLQIQILR